MQKTFTKAEKELLIQKNTNFHIAKGQLDEFVQFLHKQYNTTPETAQIMLDGSGLKLIEPKTEKKPKG